MTAEIGLRELLDLLRQELDAPVEAEFKPFLIEGAELEVHFDVHYDAKAGFSLKIPVIGGVDLGGGVGRTSGHKITLKLATLTGPDDIRPQMSPAERARYDEWIRREAE